MPPIMQAFALDIGAERQTQQLSFCGLSSAAIEGIFSCIADRFNAAQFGNNCLSEIYNFAIRFEYTTLAVRWESCLMFILILAKF